MFYYIKNPHKSKRKTRHLPSLHHWISKVQSRHEKINMRNEKIKYQKGKKSLDKQESEFCTPTHGCGCILYW
jgi:hypothetical protein